MLEKLEFVYSVVDHLFEKGHEVTDLEIHNNKVDITCVRSGTKISIKLDLGNLGALQKNEL